MTSVSEPWQDSFLSLTSALTYMRKKEVIVDVVFKRNKVPCLYGHKLILSLWSPYFANMMKQSDKSSALNINFNEDIDVMEAILEHIYSSSSSDTFTKMRVEKLIQALEITERFGMMQVHQRCLSSLQRKKVDPANVIEFLDYGLRKNLEAVVKKCTKILTFHGISMRNLNEHISVNTVLGLLTLDRIAVDREADLLNLVISWLSHPINKCYKSEILCFVDLTSLQWTEYQTIWKRFPNFFSEAELSSILLGVAQRDYTLFPNWYKPRVSSVGEKSCDTCTLVHKRLNISKCYFPKWNYSKDLMDIFQVFDFTFEYLNKTRLLSVELNFGPSDIRENEFILKFSKSGVGQWKDCYMDSVRQSNKYVALFPEPLTLKTNDSLTLKFHFRKGLAASKIRVVMPNIIESQKLNEALGKDCVKVALKFSKLAFYCATDDGPKFLVSSFCFNFCDQHAKYLIRKRIISNPDEDIIKTDSEYEKCSPKAEFFDVSKIKTEDMWID